MGPSLKQDFSGALASPPLVRIFNEKKFTRELKFSTLTYTLIQAEFNGQTGTAKKKQNIMQLDQSDSKFKEVSFTNGTLSCIAFCYGLILRPLWSRLSEQNTFCRGLLRFQRSSQPRVPLVGGSFYRELVQLKFLFQLKAPSLEEGTFCL